MLLVNPSHTVGPFEHTLLWGRGRRYYVPAFPGPLSIKSVLSGSASWTTDETRHELGQASYLVINDAHPYTIEIESTEPVETFCVFFARGFVESALLSVQESDRTLLDRPPDSAAPASFREALLPRSDAVGSALDAVSRLAGSPEGSRMVDAEDVLVRLALVLSEEHRAASRLHARVAAIRSSTRDEIFRRLCAARDVLDSSLDQALRLQDLARAAHLSPFHLHRHFQRTFGGNARGLPPKAPARADGPGASEFRSAGHRDRPRRRLYEPGILQQPVQTSLRRFAWKLPAEKRARLKKRGAHTTA